MAPAARIAAWLAALPSARLDKVRAAAALPRRSPSRKSDTSGSMAPAARTAAWLAALQELVTDSSAAAAFVLHFTSS